MNVAANQVQQACTNLPELTVASSVLITDIYNHELEGMDQPASGYCASVQDWVCQMH
jgi:hypothetical protein